MLTKLKQELQNLANPAKARILSGFFKTGKGEYGEGDVFLGITGPKQREIAKRYVDIKFNELNELLESRIHEHRQVALFILVEQYKKANNAAKKQIFDFYFRNTKGINNWDLVDLSAYKIVGDYLFDKDKLILYKLAKSDNLWERRISIVSTFHFIKNNKFEDTFRIAEILLNDKHDLLHKAVGWMLREVGKKNQAAEEKFLRKHCRKMPRTMLRYAIERFDEKKRAYYLSDLSAR